MADDKLTTREVLVMSILALATAPMTGWGIADAAATGGARISTTAAHAAGASLERRGFVRKGIGTVTVHVRYSLTDPGRAWIARHSETAGGAQ